MTNSTGYLYRVGRSRAGRRRREPKFLPVPADGWTRQEAADALDVSVSSLDTHLARGLERLRYELRDFWTGSACPPATPNPNPAQPHCPVRCAATFE
ncbi:MAG: hypothetical protein QNM02_00445 [Acidimicrobiia bacterium]|nr:hypothetical protein [Acidimicrobiia bacterium]